MAASVYATLNVLEGDPAHNAAAVTPSDTVDLANATTGLFLNAAAAQTLTVDMVGGQTAVLFTFAAAFTGIMPLRVTRVRSTGTSATGIVALWR